jgi:hypothetical protein
LLRDCQQVFENHRDTADLARILSARATLEDKLGHLDTAVSFERTALRLSYARHDPREIASCHDNLAFYLRKAGSDPAGQRAHGLAAALIYQLTGMNRDLASAQRVLAAELHEDTGLGAGAEQSPADLTDVIRIAEQTDGVRLSELLVTLQPDVQTAEDALTQIMRTAADLPPGDETGVASYPQEWEAYIAAIAAIGHGDQDMAAQLVPALDNVAENPDWSAVVGVLRRILNGERGDELLDGLDAIDTAIVRETLTRIAEPD